MIRIDAMWLAADPIDMRAGAERLLARVVQVFGAAQAHQDGGLLGGSVDLWRVNLEETRATIRMRTVSR